MAELLSAPRQVLVVQVNRTYEPDALAAIRADIVNAIQTGVWVIGPGVTYRLESLPNLGGVQVLGRTEPEEPPQETSQSANLFRSHDEPVVTGAAAEKRRIMQRLHDYREEHGAGCWDAVSECAGTGITPELLRDMYNGNGKWNLDDWRRVNKALDKAEKKGAKKS